MHRFGLPILYSRAGIFCLTMHMRLEDRKTRDAAFELAPEELRPERALMRAMVEARVRAGLTQVALAQRMGTKQPVIARLEAGRRSPNIRTLRKLAAATGSRLVVRLEEIAQA